MLEQQDLETYVPKLFPMLCTSDVILKNFHQSKTTNQKPRFNQFSIEITFLIQ